MNKLLVNIICCLIPKKRNRDKFKEKFYHKKLSFFEALFFKQMLNVIEINTEQGKLDYSNYLSYYGQLVPDVKLDKIVYQRYFKDKVIENGICLECGALDGITFSNGKFFEETLGWSVYNIEPTPFLFKECCKNRPNCKNFNFGLSSKNGELDFIVYRNGGELNKVVDNISNMKENASDGVIKIPVITYKEFIETNNISHINYFSLDVEGHEREIIKGMQNCSVLPDVFVLEGNGKEYNDLLKPMGYLFDFQYGFNAFYVKKDCVEKYGMKLI